MDSNFLARIEECLLMCDPKGLQVSGPNMKVTAYFGAPVLLAECEVELRSAIQQRDELLAALEEMTSMIDSGDEPGAGSEWHHQAKAAIAKAKEGLK